MYICSMVTYFVNKDSIEDKAGQPQMASGALSKESFKKAIDDILLGKDLETKNKKD